MKITYIAFIVVAGSLFGHSSLAYAESWLSKLTPNLKNQRETLWFDELTAQRKARENETKRKQIEQQLNQSVSLDLQNQKILSQPQHCLSQNNLKNEQQIELIDAIERAVCRNPETKSAWVQTRIQAAQFKISKANYYPQVNSTLNYDWSRDDNQVKNRPVLSYDTDLRRYGLGIRANWLLYDFGSRFYQGEEAEKLLAMSLAQHDVALQNMIIKTISTYYQIIQAELKLNNINELVVLAEKNYEIANARYRAGVGIKSDALQMSANLAKAKSDQTKFLGDLKIAKGLLASLMGEPAYQNFKINNRLKIPKELDLKPIEILIQDAEKMHPKFKAAQYNSLAAENKIKAIQRSRYPSVSFNGIYDQQKQTSDSYGSDRQSLQAGVQVNFPLFDGYNRKNQIVVAQENLKLKQLEQERLKLEINAEIWKSYNELNAIHDNIKALTILNQSASEAYEVAQGRYKAGVGNLLEVLNAQNVLSEAKMNYSTLLTEFLVVRYQLLSNMGNLNIWNETQAQ